MDDHFWQEVLIVRNAVNKVIEEKRNAGVLGSALEAEVSLYCNENLLDKLNLLQDELRFVLITSRADVFAIKKMTDDIKSASVKVELKEEDDTSNKELFVLVKAAAHTKCERCWHRIEDVNSNSEYPNICNRCLGRSPHDGTARQCCPHHAGRPARSGSSLRMNNACAWRA